MPHVEIVLFREDNGSVPLRDWLDSLPRKAQAKCVAAIRRLELSGTSCAARKLHDLRVKADLSQRALAKAVGTTASVICQLEDADYRGHSLSMLKRIATALNRRVEIRFVPIKAGAANGVRR